jgi:hypothetical protein
MFTMLRYEEELAAHLLIDVTVNGQHLSTAG